MGVVDAAGHLDRLRTSGRSGAGIPHLLVRVSLVGGEDGCAHDAEPQPRLQLGR